MHDRHITRRLSLTLSLAAIGAGTVPTGAVSQDSAKCLPEFGAGSWISTYPSNCASESALHPSHISFRHEFLAWLAEARNRLALPVSVREQSERHTELALEGVHPAIWASLVDDVTISVGVDWDGECWDLLASPDVYAQPADGRDPASGWVNSLYVPEAQVRRPTREAVWREDGFEDLLRWINETLAPAKYLGLWRQGRGTWARLIRDDVDMCSGQRIRAKDDPVHLLPVRGPARPARPGTRIARANTPFPAIGRDA